jgi:hypothetical protein
LREEQEGKLRELTRPREEAVDKKYNEDSS